MRPADYARERYSARQPNDGPAYPDADPLDPSLDETEFEIIFLESIAESCPDFFEALTLLGNHYTAKGFYEKGLRMDLRLARMAPGDPVIRYNLACSFALTERIDDAFAALKQAIGLGYDDFRYMAGDTDLDNLRDDPRFDELVSRTAGPPTVA